MIHRLFIFKVCLGFALLFGLIRHVFCLFCMFVKGIEVCARIHTHTYPHTHSYSRSTSKERTEKRLKTAIFPTKSLHQNILWNFADKYNAVRQIVSSSLIEIDWKTKKLLTKVPSPIIATLPRTLGGRLPKDDTQIREAFHIFSYKISY